MVRSCGQLWELFTAAPYRVGGGKCQTACKPGSVRTGRCCHRPALNDHSSATRVAARLTRPTRAARRECPWRRSRAAGRPYSVLLPVGFTLPPLSPGARCALAAPFHPCPRPMVSHARRAVCFLWHCPWGRPRRPLAGTVFPWSPDFPPPRCRGAAAVVQPSGARVLARRRAGDKRSGAADALLELSEAPGQVDDGGASCLGSRQFGASEKHILAGLQGVNRVT